MAELLQKNGNLKAFGLELKQALSEKYTQEGQIMPKELQEAPVALSPRKEVNPTDEIRKS